ncbi:hypothetical protein SNE40_002455 [Patella caerulea]|uniref:Prokaryotic-type class I peptide chain release factors domain-containing protein n=1 Tax=Patella caerulea TaxID=87958 RepID=A0AAN8PSG9_PATCE
MIAIWRTHQFIITNYISKYLLCNVYADRVCRRTNNVLAKIQTLQFIPRCYLSKKTHKFPDILESDLEEQFVRGSGPGGQNVNKTSNNCVLKHKPTGIVVKCHESRLLATNREMARQKLIEKLDVLYNGENSFAAKQRREDSQKRSVTKQKNKKRLEMKMEFKEREGLE